MDYYRQESERLKYRKVTKNDVSSWEEFFIANDKLKFLGMDIRTGQAVLSEEWINRQLNRYEKTGLGLLAVELKTTGILIGMGGITLREVDEKEECEITYAVKPKYWGNGFATEIAQTMKEFGLKNIETNRLISIIDLEHKNSARVAEKNGMEILFKSVYEGMKVNIYGINKTVHKTM